jgi:hypothetical protein
MITSSRKESDMRDDWIGEDSVSNTLCVSWKHGGMCWDKKLATCWFDLCAGERFVEEGVCSEASRRPELGGSRSLHGVHGRQPMEEMHAEEADQASEH